MKAIVIHQRTKLLSKPSNKINIQCINYKHDTVAELTEEYLKESHATMAEGIILKQLLKHLYYEALVTFATQ